MSTFDAICIFFIVFCSITSYSRGFIKSALGLLGWVLSFSGTYIFFPHISALCIKNFGLSEFMSFLLATGGGMLSFLIVFAVINGIVGGILSSIMNDTIDSILGAIFGVLKGFLWIVVLFMCYLVVLENIHGKDMHAIYAAKDDGIAEFIKKSKGYEFIKDGVNTLLFVLPENLRNNITTPSDIMKKVVDDVLSKNKSKRLITPDNQSEQAVTQSNTEPKENDDASRKQLAISNLDEDNSQKAQGIEDPNRVEGLKKHIEEHIDLDK